MTSLWKIARKNKKYYIEGGKKLSFTYEVLDKWKRRGADNKSKNTYEMIVGLLKKYCSDIVDVNSESVFLQGSYANHTNIKDDSDIDVVVMAKNVFGHNANEVLSPIKIEEFNKTYLDSHYSLAEFKESLYQRLNCKPLGNGWVHLERGNKTLKFNQNEEFWDFVPVDIVPAFEYRKYYSNSEIDKNKQIEGIKIYDSYKNEFIINYPQIHKQNGEAKNQIYRTKGNYKETIRIFKQIKKHLIDTKVISEDLMPSYHLECMLYNVPDNLFEKNLVERIDSIIAWLNKNLSMDFVEQHKMTKLFKDTQSFNNANTFLQRCAFLAEHWG